MQVPSCGERAQRPEPSRAARAIQSARGCDMGSRWLALKYPAGINRSLRGTGSCSLRDSHCKCTLRDSHCKCTLRDSHCKYTLRDSHCKYAFRDLHRKYTSIALCGIVLENDLPLIRVSCLKGDLIAKRPPWSVR